MVEVQIPQGVNIQVQNGIITAKGPKGSASHSYNTRSVKVSVQPDKLVVSTALKETREVRALVGSTEAHARNLISGVQKHFEKRLTAVYAHFPMSIEVKGKQVLIKNFLGEKTPRVSNIVSDTKVEAKGTDVTVTGADKEAVGQTASNLVKATYVRKKDRRIFQDGIYPTQ